MACHLLTEMNKRDERQSTITFNINQADWRMTLETIISLGVFGWMAVGMVLMGLGIW